ncbi:MAG: hypothetical protein PHW24_00665, partial [Candidatus Moranbacteria bacterium]|nr:hypothetical protein [Candidatus Moranbacteria bacterium]
MKKIIAKHRLHWKNKSFVFSTLSSIMLFVLSMFISDAAANFATERASTNVPDLIISNIPVFNVNFIVNDVALIYSIFILALLFFDPKKIPFVLK